VKTDVVAKINKNDIQNICFVIGKSFEPTFSRPSTERIINDHAFVTRSRTGIPLY
jgi:hypothetical protein